ncbi:hypothetical protein DPMN_029622 [Dreissena polymorpha]|uniref:C-type lectin domain-containing protein n=1 Tax=Dreissena polymorpha TaxID=45954 RepID=A0A9D4LYH9_DREPO|nr:hypothetical protein DPMN_029622 [Dreissena polymorpha]
MAVLDHVSSCDQGWIHFHDSCYFLALDKLVTYREAEEFCEQVDADIVLPNDAAEDKFIVGQLALASGDGFEPVTPGVLPES